MALLLTLNKFMGAESHTFTDTGDQEGIGHCEEGEILAKGEIMCM
jgi:hypothetical protein